MNKKSVLFLIGLCVLYSASSATKIDRKVLVERHNVTITENNA